MTRSSVADITQSYVFNEKVLDYVRFVAHQMQVAGGHAISLIDRYPKSANLAAVHKASVGAGTSVTGNWAAQALAEAFVGFTQPATIIGQIANLRTAPFMQRVSRQTAALSIGWVGQGGSKPLTAAQFEQTSLDPTKLAGIIVFAEDLFRLTSPAAEVFLRDEMRNALIAFMDRVFVDPAQAAVPGVSPASITAGVTPIASTGDATTDIKALVAAFVAGGGSLQNSVFITSAGNVIGLDLEDLLREDGTLGGRPLIGSDAVGDRLLLVDARGILVADEGTVNIRDSNVASLQMVDNPVTGATAQVSLFQTNSRAVLVERFINWEAQDGAVAYVDDANYLATGSPA